MKIIFRKEKIVVMITLRSGYSKSVLIKLEM